MPGAAVSADSILTTAEQLIRESGSTEWTVRALCRELECAPGAIYRHFPGGVDAIGAEIRGRHLVELAAAMELAQADPEAPGLASLLPASVAAQLARRCRCYLTFARSQGEVYRSFFALSRAGQRCQAMEIAEECLVDLPAELIRRAALERELNRPSIGRLDSERIAMMIWSRLHGHADLMLSHLVDDRLDDLEDRLLIDILGGAGFKVAAFPAGLEAAARAARSGGR